MKAENSNLAEGILFTDFYQLTMAQLYYLKGMHEKEAQFEFFFRSYPDYGKHKAGYCINAGLESFWEWAGSVRLRDEEGEYLSSQKGKAGRRIFSNDFLAWLKEHGDFSRLSVQAIPEGRVIHPHTPLVIIRGPLAVAQIFESALLNHFNYQILIATKACRIKEAGRRQLMIDFGMRRAHGKGANAGSRAALIGGADFTSNTGISYALGYPPKGTHAHSMVQAFMAEGKGELGAFRAYAQIYPDDCLLLVDTIDTLKSGLPNAIKVFQELKKKGHTPGGIRLDSGDLAYLSIQAASMLNKAGFEDTSIVLSNQLDELVIWQILSQIREEAPRYGLDPGRLINRLVYGVGTRLITSRGDSALDGIYKLTAVKDNNEWKPAIKISENPAKVINPGCKRLWRIYDKRNKAVGDYLSLEEENPKGEDKLVLRHPLEAKTRQVLNKKDIQEIEPLLVDIFKDGKRVYDFPAIDDMRKIRDADLGRLDSGVKRLINPHIYHISLSERLWEFKQDLISQMNEGG